MLTACCKYRFLFVSGVFMIIALVIFDKAEDMDAGITTAPHDGFINANEVRTTSLVCVIIAMFCTGLSFRERSQCRVCLPLGMNPLCIMRHEHNTRLPRPTTDLLVSFYVKFMLFQKKNYEGSCTKTSKYLLSITSQKSQPTPLRKWKHNDIKKLGFNKYML